MSGVEYIALSISQLGFRQLNNSLCLLGRISSLERMLESSASYRGF